MKHLFWHCRNIFLAGILMSPASFAAETIHSVTVAEGITQKYALITPDNTDVPITRLVALFTGGDGDVNMGLHNGAAVYVGRGLMVDGRKLFLRPGTAVIIVDSPSSMQQMSAEFRESKAYLTGTALVLNRVQTQFPNTRLYLVGHSSGSISALELAAQMKEKVDGVVALGGVYRSLKKLTGVVPTQPSLFIHHEKDACSSPFYQDDFIAHYKPVFVQDIGAYFPSKCGPYSAHHFHGQESLVVDSIYRWMQGEKLPERIR